ncbi:hypothetical protein B0I35DRAFT_364299 [Stachybotrys elegans]|uniref:6-methylsalicylate decarboxylase n=1 Tax=Stachybotrys elegans TaxID=80388 RepID=A0A8K0S965_9HYPO|nr:hypothetical protein B0I35DRAFT_364299 [Stachybotrys elegans]
MGFIDVHHHFLPSQYTTAWMSSGTAPPGLTLPPWSVESDLAFMDRRGIDVALLSLSAPSVCFMETPREQKLLARQVNEAAAAIRDLHPTRFGFFATLPCSNIDDGIEEARYTLDVLKADGVALLTSYNGMYLGHEQFGALWEELDNRSAVVFIHPATSIDPGIEHDTTIPRPIIDFPHETTRTAVHLITSETIRNYTNCKIILSHGGGTLPFIATRVAHQAADINLINKTAEEFIAEAKTLYLDLAITSFEDPLSIVRRFAGPERVLWGSDFPFVREITVGTQLGILSSLEENTGVSVSMETAIAARRLFPASRWNNP